MRNRGRSIAVPPTQTPGTKPHYEPGKKPPSIWKPPKGTGPKHYGQGNKGKGGKVSTQIQPGSTVKPKGGKPKGGKGGGGATYGALGDFPGVRVGEAVSLVNAQLKPEIRQTQNDIQTTRRETQLERQRANRQYNAAVGDIGHIYGETGDYINYQNNLVNQNFDALSGQTQTAQQALMQHLQGTGQQALTQSNDEIARLGIEGMPYTQTMQQDQAFTTDQAAISGANNMANLNLSHQNSQELGNLLLGMNTGSQTAAYGRAANAKSDALFEAQANKHTAVEQLKRTLKDLRMSRPDLVNQMLEQLMQSRWGQYMDASQLSLQHEELGLQRSAQRAANRRASAYANRSGASYGGGSSGSSSGGSATGDGSDSESGGPTGDPFSNLVIEHFGGKPKPPKPGKRR